MMAVNYLVKSKRKDALLTYYQHFQRLSDADTNFQQAFGVSLGEFAQQFPVYVRGLP